LGNRVLVNNELVDQLSKLYFYHPNKTVKILLESTLWNQWNGTDHWYLGWKNAI